MFEDKKVKTEEKTEEKFETIELVLRNTSIVHIPFFLKNSFGGKDNIPEGVEFDIETDHPEFVDIEMLVQSHTGGMLTFVPLASHAEFKVTLSATDAVGIIFDVKIIKEKDAEPLKIALDMDNVAFVIQDVPPEVEPIEPVEEDTEVDTFHGEVGEDDERS